jgi:putative spermidine/putrescine transport system permease protein
VTLILGVTLLFLIGPVVLTIVGSFATGWAGVFPSGVGTLANWRTVLGLDAAAGQQAALGSSLARSVSLAFGGVVVNLLVGVPVAYAVARYEFAGRDWVRAFAVLPLAPGIVLGIAFLRAYPRLSGSLALIVGYSLLKAPFMVVAVLSSFEPMDLRRIEESARSLGAPWWRTFLTVIVPNARAGIVAGAIICWTLAAAEFNFSYLVYSDGAPPLALFLFANISNNSFVVAAAAVSVFFVLVVAVIGLLQFVGYRGFSMGDS